MNSKKGDGKLIFRIKELTKKNGINIKKLEERCGLSNGSVRRWKVSMPTIDKIAAIAKEFDVSLDYLYFGEVDRSANDLSLLSYFHELPDSIQQSCITYIHGVHDSYRLIKESKNKDSDS